MPHRYCPVMPQITAVDDQFGTHKGEANNEDYSKPFKIPS
jgi:hypothetical protein